MEFKCALSHCYIISPLNVRASIYYLLKMQPAGCYKHRILLAVFTHRYGCCILQLELVLASKNCYALQSKDPSAYRFLCVCVCVCVRVQLFSSVWLFAAPWAAARQSLLFMVFSRQEHWSELPFLSPGDLPNPGIEPASPVLQEDSLLLSHQGSPLQGGKGYIEDIKILIQSKQTNKN